MKQLFLAIALLLISCSLFAADMPANAYPLPWQSEKQPRILLDDGSVVGSSNPLPVDIGASVEIGAVTVEAFPVYKDASGTPATAELDSNGYVKTNLVTDSIGLITAINAVTAAVNGITVTIDTTALEAAQASTTASVDAVNASVQEVKTAVNAVETAVNNISVSVDTTDLEAAQASTTAAVEAVETAINNQSFDSTAIVAAQASTTSAVNELRHPISEAARQVVNLAANTASGITSGLTGDRKFIQVTTMDNTKDFYLDVNNTAVIGSCLRVYGGYYLELPKTVSVSVIASEAIDLFVLEGGF